MNVGYYRRQFVHVLRQGADQNVSRYQSEPGWAGREAQASGAFYESQRAVGLPPQLRYGNGEEARNDALNARLIHQWLGALPAVVAMDERLWAWTAHAIFPQYMAARWPADRATTVRRRYLFEGSSFAALSRHGIARLWWAGHLTHDPDRPDPYELTGVLFHRQDVQVALFERAIGKCQSVRRGVLEFLLEHRAELSQEAYGRRIQIFDA